MYLSFEQRFANFASDGHGDFLSFKNSIIEKKIINPAVIKVSILYLDIIVIQGNTEIILANAAPIPSVISNAGKAQQINVLKLANKLSKGVKNCLNKFLFTVYLNYIITRIIYYLFYGLIVQVFIFL